MASEEVILEAEAEAPYSLRVPLLTLTRGFCSLVSSSVAFAYSIQLLHEHVHQNPAHSPSGSLSDRFLKTAISATNK